MTVPVALQGFVNGEEPTIDADWLNALDVFWFTVFGGAQTVAQARTALGLGTMALQNANAVAITGGTLAGITSLNVSGQAKLSGTISAAIAGNQNNYSPTGLATASTLRIDTGGGVFDITGIAAQPEGTLLTIENVTTTNSGFSAIRLLFESASSLANNRILFQEITSELPLSILTRGSVTLKYSTNRWYVIHSTPNRIVASELLISQNPAIGFNGFRFVCTGLTAERAITVPDRSFTLGTDPVLDTAKATTSGTTWDYTIPSWVQKITAMWDQFSTTGTSEPLMQLGTGGVPTTSGYRGSVSGFTAAAVVTENSATGCLGATAALGAAGAVWNGSIVFTRMSGNTWAYEGGLGRSDTTTGTQTRGTVTLAGALDFFRFTTLAADTGDAGSVNLMYE